MAYFIGLVGNENDWLTDTINKTKAAPKTESYKKYKIERTIARAVLQLFVHGDYNKLKNRTRQLFNPLSVK